MGRRYEPEVQSRFAREIHQLQKMDQVNIVRVIAVDLHEGDVYCVMKLIE